MTTRARASSGGAAVRVSTFVASLVVGCASISCHHGGPGAANASTDDVLIRRHAPSIGGRAHVETTHVRKGALALRTADGPVRTIDLDVYEKSVRDEVVLAADEFHPTRLQVDYIEKTHVEHDAQGEHVTTAPLSAKRYVVEARDGKLVVVRDGKTAPDEEASAVIDDYKALLDPDIFAADAFAQPISMGRESAPIEAALAALMHLSNEDSVVAPPRAVLVGTDGEGADKSAVFQVELALAHVISGDLPIRETLQMAGEYRLVVDGGWASRVTVQGPTAYSSADPARLACEGEGQISLDLRRSYAGPSTTR